MTGVLIRKEHLETQRQRPCEEGHGKTRADTEMRPQAKGAKDARSHQKRQEVRKHGSLCPCWHLDFGLLPSRMVGEHLSVVWRHLTSGNSLQQPWDTNRASTQKLYHPQPLCFIQSQSPGARTVGLPGSGVCCPPTPPHPSPASWYGWKRAGAHMWASEFPSLASLIASLFPKAVNSHLKGAFTSPGVPQSSVASAYPALLGERQRWWGSPGWMKQSQE